MLTSIAFELGYRKYHQALVRRAGDHADAEDVAQDAWAEAWKAREGLDMPGLWRWLCTMVKRVWWQRLNDRSNGKAMPKPVAVEIEDSALEPTQHESAGLAQVAHAIPELPAAQAVSGKLALAGHDGADIARIRGVSLSAATQALRMAVEALRKKWRITA